MNRIMRNAWGWVWAFPCTALGLFLGCGGLMTGGRVRRIGRIVEFYGGVLRPLLRNVPLPGGASAMTFGHVVLAREHHDLDRCRPHELVHVRQYELWGILFIPTYLSCSAWLWWTGRDPYRDNPFEREAFQTTEPR